MAANASAEEEAIIRKRYATMTVLTTAATLPPFKKLATKYLEFCQALEGGGAAEAQRLHDDLLADLYAVQLHMGRLHAAAGAFRREQAAYAAEQEELLASIQQAEREIEERKAELVAARRELAHNQEYESVKAEVVAVPPRSASAVEADAVRRETADLSQQGADLDAAMERRRRQFAAVLHAIEEAAAAIEADGGEEGGGGGGGAAAGGASQSQSQPEAAPMQLG